MQHNYQNKQNKGFVQSSQFHTVRHRLKTSPPTDLNDFSPSATHSRKNVKGVGVVMCQLA
jgi:hypothetical protein